MIAIRKAAPLLVLLAGAVGLAGCQSTNPVASASPAPGMAAASVAPVAARGDVVAQGGCAGEIARYQTVMKNDFDTGNVNKSVYAQFQSEIARAQSACSAGRDSEAIGLVRASKARHGYPA